MSLGPEYDTIVQILESKPDITTEEVKQTIRNRFEKLNGSSKNHVSESAVIINEGNNVSFLIHNNNGNNNNNYSSYCGSFHSKFNNRPIENFRGQNDRPVVANEGNRFQNQQGQFCFSCGRIGHRAFQCRGLFRGNSVVVDRTGRIIGRIMIELAIQMKDAQVRIVAIILLGITPTTVPMHFLTS